LKIIQKQKEEISYLSILSQTQDKSKRKPKKNLQVPILEIESREENPVEERDRNPAEDREEEEEILVTRKKVRRNSQKTSSNSKKASPSTLQDDEEYEIEKILDYKAVKERNQINSYYLVKWKNYGEESNSWEPIENLENASLKIQAFIEMKKKGVERTL
jgi:hypothetical protein